MKDKISGIIKVSPQSVKKFYFLDYFYILLKSVKEHKNFSSIFEEFKSLKYEYKLGESKYRKLTQDTDDLTATQQKKHLYTLRQVLFETMKYNLIVTINIESKPMFKLTPHGENGLIEYKKGKSNFYKYIFAYMEEKTRAFYHLLNLSYEHPELKNGLMVFPIYSPSKFGYKPSYFKLTENIIEYSSKLVSQLEQDLRTYTNKSISLKDAENELLTKLMNDGIIHNDPKAEFDPIKFNPVVSRFRKFWLNYFLKNVYNYDYSYSTFNIWIERGKQLGILHTTEFFPNFNGRIVFPTSLIVDNVSNNDFVEFFKYSNNKKLYVYTPNWSKSENQEEFVDSLMSAYFHFKSFRRTHFINLIDIKERVCFKMRIPSFVFDDFLQNAYNYNLKGQLRKIQISLEADRLPEETTAMYLKREPILINDKLKNIIAINYTK